jgi:hypothetical protein
MVSNDRGSFAMALFFERVSLGPAENVGMILDRYGIDAARWSEVQQLSQNAHILQCGTHERPAPDRMALYPH